ncbi:LysR family transcriptional regulator [Sphingomonas ginkgonis]|uniref:LysR family transcriptional regulator n=1 Tax=Sphingomonas ginkgonis TaxID=2315330 RepID=A0A429V8H8_9SPHN|nr:LysR family transcriptional regulator [Sphingomonas ginkgonis]RST30259.1 LysR family transcriptional regulator [Sphingomonas ginkgonis]
MPRHTIDDLLTFRAVARERSFTRAAAQMGLSPSAISHAIRGLEERLGIRLLTRTTRSVAPTEVGERLLGAIGPRFDEIEAEISALSELRDKPAGTIRITTGMDAARSILWPAAVHILRDYPDIKLEISVNPGFVDIVAERFDAGIRLGETIAHDMVAVRIGPDLSMAAVASPAYFASHKPPRTPHDLSNHNCINLRFPTLGGLYAWEFEKRGRPLIVRVDGQLIVNETSIARQAAMDGNGIAFLPDNAVAAELESGRLVKVLKDWTPPFPGYHLYYPSRRQQTPAFALLVEALRHRG